MNNQKITVAIVEDDNHYADVFEKYLKRYEEESGTAFQVIRFNDGADITENYKAVYDIILMDIEMKFLDGMTAAQRIRERDSDVIIIFITNMPQYAMKGYSVDALDFVLKPVNYYSFSQRIKRSLERISNRTVHFISVPVKNGMIKLNVEDITYVEVQNHDLTYHTSASSITTRGTISEAEEKLLSYNFYRISKPYLVNLACVDGLTDGQALIGDKMIPVSRTKRKDFMDALNNYINDASK
jgi:DNA-binding LytR/AlgR family response regulator